MSRDKDIVIVGAGLVGSLLSIYLARRGYKVAVYERRIDMRQHPTAGGRSINMALSNRGIRALEEVGVAGQMKETAVSMPGRMMHGLDGALTFQPYGKEGQFIHSISRARLNMVLMDEAEKQGVEFFFDHRCLHTDLEKTEIQFQHYAGTARRAADLIIGTDGAYSAVRGALQVADRFDFSQDYIEHGYKELRIPPGPDGGFVMDRNALHIWPRESFMLIALPNPDATFTCTLFLPFEGKNSFSELKNPEKVQAFFDAHFPDAAALMPTLVEDFRDNPTSSLPTIRCFPWHKRHTLLMGDAAHGIVPFFGQGMNAGFEDCRILNRLLDEHNDNWTRVLPHFQELRKPDTDAIARLALDNFIEMRDLVADADFLLRKKIEARLHELFPEKWVPLYSMVTFHDQIRYSEALAAGNKQKAVMDEVMKRPDIEKNWPHLDFAEIVKKL